MTAVKLTKTQQAFFDLMADGQRHYMAEFINLLPDELSGVQGVENHIKNLRAAIRPFGQDVVHERINRNRTYRRVRLLSPGE